MATSIVFTEPVVAEEPIHMKQQLPPLDDDTPHVAQEEPKTTRFDRRIYVKVGAAGLAFFVAGINDGSTGALMPYFLREYHVSTAVVSVLYASNFMGWLIGAATNAHLMDVLDLGGVLVLGTIVQLIAQILRVWKAPFPLFIITFCIVCMGQAYQDTGGNTYCSSTPRAHLCLAIIHAMYMGGCLVAPFVATAVATADKPSRWWLYYAFPIGIGGLNTIITSYAYRDTVKMPCRRRRSTANTDSTSSAPQPTDVPEESAKGPTKSPWSIMKEALSLKSVWLLSLFYFFYLGAMLTSSGWVVEYLVQVRHGDLATMGYVPAGLSGGTFLGRLLLAEPIHRIGERCSVFVLALLCLVFQIVFLELIRVSSIIAAAIAVSLVGFFCAPFFATGMSVASRLISEDVRPTAMAFIFVFAQAGGNLFPLITGIIATKAGVSVLQPILIGLWVCTAISWLLVPRVKKANNPDLHDE